MKTKISVLSLFLLLLPLVAQAQTKRALVIGLGEQLDPTWRKIHGDKDVTVVCNMLKRHGFSNRNILTLVNRQATKSGIMSGFKRLRQQSKPGDIVYIHFSGHGQQMTDVNGDERGRRSEGDNDRLDESWVPYDAFFAYGPQDRGEKHLSDDELSRELTALRQQVGNRGKILVVVDACHSGGGTRHLATEVADSTDAGGIRGCWENFKIPHRGAKRSGARPEEAWITLSACKSYQSNEEMQGSKIGRLTHNLCTIINEGKRLDNGKLLATLTEYYNRKPGYRVCSQTPTMTGATTWFNICSIFF